MNKIKRKSEGKKFKRIVSKMKYTNCNYILLYTQQAIHVNNMAPVTRLVAVSGLNSWLPWHSFAIIYSLLFQLFQCVFWKQRVYKVFCNGKLSFSKPYLYFFWHLSSRGIEKPSKARNFHFCFIIYVNIMNHESLEPSK